MNENGKHVVVGVVSYGFGCGSTTPGVYARYKFLGTGLHYNLLLVSLCYTSYDLSLFLLSLLSLDFVSLSNIEGVLGNMHCNLRWTIDIVYGFSPTSSFLIIL